MGKAQMTESSAAHTRHGNGSFLASDAEKDGSIFRKYMDSPLVINNTKNHLLVLRDDAHFDRLISEKKKELHEKFSKLQQDRQSAEIQKKIILLQQQLQLTAKKQQSVLEQQQQQKKQLCTEMAQRQQELVRINLDLDKGSTKCNFAKSFGSTNTKKYFATYRELKSKHPATKFSIINPVASSRGNSYMNCWYYNQVTDVNEQCALK